MTFPPRTADYVRSSDGAVVVPARVADDLLVLVTRGVIASRKLGLPVNLEMNVVLSALQLSAMAEDARSSASGSTVADSVSVGNADELISVSEAALRVGCSARAIRAAIGNGRLRAVRPGGRDWLIRAPDLETYRFGGSAA